jgi:hypothetical protein
VSTRKGRPHANTGRKFQKKDENQKKQSHEMLEMKNSVAEKRMIWQAHSI